MRAPNASPGSSLESPMNPREYLKRAHTRHFECVRPRRQMVPDGFLGAPERATDEHSFAGRRCEGGTSRVLSSNGYPPPRGSSMAGRFSGAGGRLPIRHGVGWFATKFIHSLIRTFSVYYVAIRGSLGAAERGGSLWRMCESRTRMRSVSSRSSFPTTNKTCPHRHRRPLLSSWGPKLLLSSSATAFVLPTHVVRARPRHAVLTV